MAAVGLAASLLLLAAGCVSTDRDDEYISRIIAETLGDVPDGQRAGPVPTGARAESAVPNMEEAAFVPAEAAMAGVEDRQAAEAGETAVERIAPTGGAATPPAEPSERMEGASLPHAIEAASPSGKTLGVVTIQPDTILWISVDEDASLNGRYIANEFGAIDFGYVGLILLGDMTTEQAEAKIRATLEGRYLNKATVTVRIAKASYDRLGVHGAVEVPGMVKIGPGSAITLREALRRAGGIRLQGRDMMVKIVRQGMKSPFGSAAEGEIYPLSLENGDAQIPRVYLRNDDLVYVYNREADKRGVGGKKIILLGEVPRRGVVEFSENEPCTLMHLLFKIGGLPRFAKANAIRIVHRDKDGRERVRIVDAEKLLADGSPENDVQLYSGDRVIVPVRKISFF